MHETAYANVAAGQDIRPSGALDMIADRLGSLIEEYQGATNVICAVCDRAGLYREPPAPMNDSAKALSSIPTALSTINDRIDRLFMICAELGEHRRRLETLA
jgi:hypothetical protein